MIPWKDRLYAFFLSRVLGPWLDDESLKLLHESIEVSLQEGRIVLKQIGLNTQNLTGKLGKSDWRICQATVGRLEVALSLEDVDTKTDSDDRNVTEIEQSSITSLAWRAMALGSTPTGGGKIALMAKVVLEGLVIHVKPGHDDQGGAKQEEEEEMKIANTEDSSSNLNGEQRPTGSTFTSTARYLLSSYLEAALAALRLSVEIHQLTIRLHTQEQEQQPFRNSNLQFESIGQQTYEQALSPSSYPWLELRIKSISYHDADKPASPPMQNRNSTSSYHSIDRGASPSLSKISSTKPSYSTVMHKAVDVTRISLAVGTTTIGHQADGLPLSATTTMLLLEGITQVRMRVIEYNNATKAIERSSKPSSSDESEPTLQQDVEVFFGHKLNLYVDQDSLQRLLRIVSNVRGKPSSSRPNKASKDEYDAEQVPNAASSKRSSPSKSDPPPRHLRFSSESVDEKALGGIMEQYNEARRRAERNEVRGGLLLPNTTEITDGDVLTFDAFFDANDQSFYRYSTMLRKSQASVTSANDGSTTTNDLIHTKLRCHLNSASAKVALQQQQAHEYILATIADVQLSSSLSSNQSTHSFSVSHFEIEEGRADRNSLQSLAIVGILSFPSSHGDIKESINHHMETDDDHEILVQAPCIAVSAMTSCARDERQSADPRRNAKAATTVKVDADIEPFVLTCPPTLIHNLSLFITKAFMNEKDVCLPILPKAETGKEIDSDPLICLGISCAHVDITIPLEHISHDAWSPFYSRPGISKVNQFGVSESALCVRVERLFIQTNDSSYDQSDEYLDVSFQHILGYLYLHQESNDNLRVLDLFALTEGSKRGYFRVSYFELQQAASKRESPAAQVFLDVPAISSFKARQEDDDYDDPILSPAEQFRIASRRELRGTNPQPQMLDAVTRANILVELSIPRVALDLSVEEIAILAEVLRSQKAIAQIPTEKSVDKVPSQDSISLSISFDRVSIALHESCPSHDSAPIYSYLFQLVKVRTNIFLEGDLPQHIRFLIHDAAFHEVEDLLQTNPVFINQLGSTEERVDSVLRRVSISSRTKTNPILHRSHIFTPISHQNPVILLDVIGLSGSVDTTEKRIFLTLYDLTYRFDFDAQWLRRLRSLVTRLRDVMPHGNGSTEYIEGQNSPNIEKNSLMTRLFICLADCNIDYSSPSRWPTSARAIFRFGEVHISSSLIRPSPDLQAIKLSVADFACALCNTRFPYLFENSKLIDAETVRQMEDVPLTSNATPADILLKMNLRNILMVDCLDAVFTLNRSISREPSQPQLHVGLNIGQINFFACKDSFVVFAKTIGEFCSEACAMDDETFQRLKKSSGHEETYYDTIPHEDVHLPNEIPHPNAVFEDLKYKNGLKRSVETAKPEQNESSFLLDGYDWTTINQDESVTCSILPGDEQGARWYGEENASGTEQRASLAEATSFRRGGDPVDSPQKQLGKHFQLITHHFPFEPSDPLADGDMGASKYVGTNSSPPQVKNRITVSDLSLKVRLFDGYDWPECLPENLRAAPRTGSFVIDLDEGFAARSKGTDSFTSESERKSPDPKTALMAGLLADQKFAGTFDDLPLPEECEGRRKSRVELTRLSRRMDKCVQFSLSGVRLRTDGFEESDKHRLASCLDIEAHDFFLAETISSKKPIKMAGEWFNDIDHPRDSSEGLFVMKMVTWYASDRVGPDNNIVNDECEAAMKVLPLRCFLDQRAILFLSAFFKSDSSDEEKGSTGRPAGLHSIPPPLFRKFIAKPLKLKVNYKPQKLDQNALYNGQIVELLNLTPLESLILTLQQVEIVGVVGFGGVVTVLVPQWIQHVSSTQLVKFLTKAKPFQPIATVGEGFSDMVVLPWEALRQGGDVHKAFRAGATSFGLAVAYEALTLSSEVAEVVASVGAGGPHFLPARPIDVPASVKDTTSHIFESLSRGLQAANTKIVIIPYHEYQRNGTTGLVSSVIRGIPVAITAPTSGVAEAISYALIGMRNRLRPDIRKEEEVSQRGLRFGG